MNSEPELERTVRFGVPTNTLGLVRISSPWVSIGAVKQLTQTQGPPSSADFSTRRVPATTLKHSDSGYDVSSSYREPQAYILIDPLTTSFFVLAILSIFRNRVRENIDMFYPDGNLEKTKHQSKTSAKMRRRGVTWEFFRDYEPYMTKLGLTR